MTTLGFGWLCMCGADNKNITTCPKCGTEQDSFKRTEMFELWVKIIRAEERDRIAEKIKALITETESDEMTVYDAAFVDGLINAISIVMGDV